MSRKPFQFEATKLTKNISVTLLTALSLAMLCGSSADAQDVEPYGGLSLELTPLAWSFGVGGDIKLQNRGIPIDFNGGDLVSFANPGFQAQLELRERNWTIILSGLYVGLKQDSADVSLEMDQLVLEAFAGLRVFGHLDVLAGGRYFYFKPELTDGGALIDDRTQDWVDLVIGARYEKSLSRNWFVRARGDLGAGGSVFEWGLGASIYYRLLDSLFIGLAYRHLDVEYKTGSGDDEFIYNVYHTGPGLAVMLHLE
jgi:opacity protein-like surface antigen